MEVMTSSDSEGFLSRLPGVSYRLFRYRFFENKFKRLFALLWSQVVLFSAVWKNRHQTDIVYVNTLLPFGAAIAGKLAGLKVIYHLHETTVNPPILKSFLKTVAKLCASEAVYVSNFLQEQESLSSVPSRVIYNCLPADFTEQANAFLRKPKDKIGPFTVLMLCSLKGYKGVNQFVELARALPNFQFLLVLNSNFEAVRDYFDMGKLPENLIVFSSQKNVHTFYQESKVVLNLSHPEQWVETFGMTLLEGMAYGLPVIAPPVGGPAELVEDGVNGFKIDQRNHQELVDCLLEMANDPLRYRRMSKRAASFAKGFSNEKFEEKILHLVAQEASVAKVAKQKPAMSVS